MELASNAAKEDAKSVSTLSVLGGNTTSWKSQGLKEK
jgi:hypothetical protein